MTNDPHRPQHRSAHRPAGRRPLATGLLLAAVVALAGCTGTTTSSPSPSATATTEESAITSTFTPSVAPKQVPTEEVITGGAGSFTEAAAELKLDGSPVAAGTARCARAIDESTGQPTIRLLLQSPDSKDDAEVVVTDTADPRVVSAVVMRGEKTTLAGAEGLDGSTLQVQRAGDVFTVTGSLKDQSAGSTHKLELRATCQGL